MLPKAALSYKRWPGRFTAAVGSGSSRRSTPPGIRTVERDFAAIRDDARRYLSEELRPALRGRRSAAGQGADRRAQAERGHRHHPGRLTRTYP